MAYFPSLGAAWPVVSLSQQRNPLKPNGVPDSLFWKHNGRINEGVNPTGGRTFLTPWGVVQRAEGAVLNNDVLIKIRNIQCWVLSQAGAWSLLRATFRVAGQWYPENFDTVAVPALPAGYQSAAPNAIIVGLPEGRAYHFFPPAPRDQVVSADLKGIATVYEAKLISKTGQDISGEVGTILGDAGCDWWSQAEVGGTNVSSFVGGYCPVTPSWRRFFATHLRYKDMANYPPPAAFRQLTTTDPVGIDPDYIAA